MRKSKAIQRSKARPFTKKTNKISYDNTEYLKLRVDKFSRVELKVCVNPVGIGIARERPVSSD